MDPDVTDLVLSAPRSQIQLRMRMRILPRPENSLANFSHPISQLRPEGRNRRGETQLRGPEVLGPLRGLGIRPLVSAIWGLGDPFPEAR